VPAEKQQPSGKRNLPCLIVKITLCLQTLWLVACDSYKYGYRICNIENNECYDVDAKFKEKEKCLDHLERHSHACIGGKHLKDMKDGESVCTKSTGSLGYGECVDL